MPILQFPDNYFQNEKRCNFHVTAMMKRLWAAQMEILAWIDEVCTQNDIKYVLSWGSLLGAVRHKGFIPWDDDIDISMLRPDYMKFLSAVEGKLPKFFDSMSLLPGATPPKEEIYNFNNGNRLDTSPEFLERFHGCPYATGVDIFVFDKIPDNPDDFEYQQTLLKLLDRMLMLQWSVDDKSIQAAEEREYTLIRQKLERELDLSFEDKGNMPLQIMQLFDMACSLCEDCDSINVENRMQMLYYGDRGYQISDFTERIIAPFEGVMDVPIPRDYDRLMHKQFWDYEKPRPFGALHDYPIYHEQRDILYRAYKERGWKIPEEFLEYDENGKLVVDPDEI